MPEEENQNLDPDLRQPPRAGGPNRIQTQQRRARLDAQIDNNQLLQASTPIMKGKPKKSLIRKALPYIAGGTTSIAAIGTAFGLG